MDKRVIFHVDLDAFFAACEEKMDPSLKGKPVIVGADPKGGMGRGVVSTCNYEARKFGVKSAMPISIAYRLCPKAVFLKPDFELYVSESQKVMEILRAHAGKFEQVGIDEAFLDVSEETGGSFEKAAELAKEVKKEILAKQGLSCSIGVAPNKLVAKIASDFKKPGGLTVVKPGEVEKFLAPLPVRRIWGIGPKSAKRLKELGVETAGDLAGFDAVRLAEEFGSFGAWFHRAARGIDESEVVEGWQAKSVSREITFEEDTLDEREIRKAFQEICADVIEGVKAENALFQTVGVKVRFSGFQTLTRDKTLKLPAESKEALEKSAWELLEPFLNGPKKIRLIGVRASALMRIEGQKRLGEF